MSTSPPQEQSRSPSPLPAGANSEHDNDNNDDPYASQIDIPVPTLVAHLLASKRSLSSITTVYTANHLVESARSSLSSSLILSSRTSFLRTGIAAQSRILRKVRKGIDAVYAEGVRDFEEVIRRLDDADAGLQATMDVLRSTVVEAQFRPEGEEERSLLDFVDEAGVEGMRTALKESIRHSQVAQAELLESIRLYDQDIKSMKAAMSSPTSNSSYNLESPIPHVLESLEENAAEMASLLDSLVGHFDLCVNAIKHTEGGFAAVKQAATNNQLPEGVTVSGVIQEPGNDSGMLEPLSEEDRRQMLTVLSSDAAEVEDVVLELHQRLSSMEEQFEQIQDHVANLTASYNSTITAFTLLESIGSRLPNYIASSQDFLLRWQDSKAQISEQMEELESMRVFYEGYISSYQGLIEEVTRRKTAEEKMKAVLRKAMEQVKKMHDADSKEREAFRRDVGDFLPSDLWPGLVADAPRWEVSIVDDETGADDRPEMQKKTP